jgi:hypothetical protein
MYLPTGKNDVTSFQGHPVKIPEKFGQNLPYGLGDVV